MKRVWALAKRRNRQHLACCRGAHHFASAPGAGAELPGVSADGTGLDGRLRRSTATTGKPADAARRSNSPLVRGRRDLGYAQRSTTANAFMPYPARRWAGQYRPVRILGWACMGICLFVPTPPYSDRARAKRGPLPACRQPRYRLRRREGVTSHATAALRWADKLRYFASACYALPLSAIFSHLTCTDGYSLPSKPTLPSCRRLPRYYYLGPSRFG